MIQRDWESAIACFTAGVSIEGTHDDDLSSSLRAGLESAESSKAARDAARESAEGRLAEGDGCVSSREYGVIIEVDSIHNLSSNEVRIAVTSWTAVLEVSTSLLLSITSNTN